MDKNIIFENWYFEKAQEKQEKTQSKKNSRSNKKNKQEQLEDQWRTKNTSSKI